MAKKKKAKKTKPVMEKPMKPAMPLMAKPMSGLDRMLANGKR